MFQERVWSSCSGGTVVDQEDSTGVRSNKLLQFGLTKLLAHICCSWGWWGALEPGPALPAGLGDSSAAAQPQSSASAEESVPRAQLSPAAPSEAWNHPRAGTESHRGPKALGRGNSEHLTSWCCLSKVRGGEVLRAFSGGFACRKTLKVIGDHSSIMQTPICIIIMQIEMDNQL